MTNWQNIKYWTSLIILATLPILWTALQIYAFTSSSNPASLTHLTNSKGELCGEGENEGRENLLYYDISMCAGLEARYENCKSAKVDNDFELSAEQSNSETFAHNDKADYVEMFAQQTSDSASSFFLFPVIW